MRRATAIAVLVTVLCTAVNASAARSPRQATDTGFLAASRLVIGQIYLTALGEPGTTVRFGEVAGGVTTPLATGTIPPSGALAVRAATWRCDRLVRSFAAVATAPDGTVRAATYDLRTPSCANRVAILAPSHVARAARLAVRVVDRWALGDQPAQLCVSGAGLRRRCRTVRLPPNAGGTTRHVRPERSGLLRIAAALDGHRVVRRVAVGTARAVPTRQGPVLLTTGDSTIEGIDSVLADALGTAARVTSRSFPGTGLSGTGIDRWLGFARRQVRLHPAVTIVSIGANEGFPVTAPGSGVSVACCDAAWTQELARRQRQLMKLYLRGGAGRVAWLTLPVPRDAERRRITGAVDGALRIAAAGLPGVRLVDLGAIFTPDGRFHESLRRGGRLVRVRAADGIHLTAAGSAIAADAVALTVEQAGWLDAG